jgi:hypothetical protein
MRGGACLKQAEHPVRKPARRKSDYAALCNPLNERADLARSQVSDTIRAACRDVGQDRILRIEARLRNLACQFEDLRRRCELWAARNDALEVMRIDQAMRSNRSEFDHLMKEQRQYQLTKDRG